MPLRRLASLAFLLSVVPACSAIVNPDTSRLGDGNDAGNGVTDTGMPTPDTGVDGGPATCATSCDDMIPCTTDTCESGSCHHTPNDGACGAGMRCSATLGCVSMQCTGNAECADGNACNGAEVCAPGTAGADPTTGCAHGPPLSCDDQVDCTTDACDMTAGCTHTPNAALCDDHFDCTTDSCGAAGCTHLTNDAMCNGGCLQGATCQVGAGCIGGVSQMCPSDGNGCTSDPTMCDPGTGTCLHPPRDDDNDGFPTNMANGLACPGGTDCDDQDPNVHPGATETCNGVDDNCNGQIDENGCNPAGPDTCNSEGQIMLMAGAGGIHGMVSGSNIDDNDDYTVSCGHSGGQDAVYYIDIPGGIGTSAVDVTFSTDGDATTFDTVLGASIGACTFTGGTRLCNDDIQTGTNFRSRLTVCVSGALVSTGTRVHVLVDGYQGDAQGNYNLSVTVTPRTAPCP